MKKSMAVVAVVAGVIASASAQDIVIDSISGNGSMSFWGAQVGTTATVEWAASLTDTGRTNWHGLTNVVVTDDIVSTDIPMFFLVRGTPDTNLMAGLVAYYPFNGNPNDESGNGYNLAVTGGTSLSGDRFGHPTRSYYFDGLSNSLTLATGNVSISNTFSVSVWFKPLQNDNLPSESTSGTSYSHTYVVFPGQGGTESGIGISGGMNGICVLEHGNAFLPAVLVYPASLGSSWVHAVVTCENSGNPVLYVNGIKVRTGLQTSRTKVCMLWQDSYQGIGGGGYGHFNGQIDDIRIYDRALTSNEVYRLSHLPY